MVRKEESKTNCPFCGKELSVVTYYNDSNEAGVENCKQEDSFSTTEQCDCIFGSMAEQPYKIKAGVLDFWIPTYLYIRRLDYSLFGANGVYVPEVNMEFFDLLKKHPSDFTIKGYSEDGVKLAFYNQYRKFINVEEYGEIKGHLQTSVA